MSDQSHVEVLQEVAEELRGFQETATAQVAEVQMLRSEVIVAAHKADMLEAAFRRDRERQRTERTRFRVLVVMFSAAMVLLFGLALINRYYNQVLVNCTTPGHACYDTGLKRQAEAIGAITDQDKNGVADNAQILARLRGEPEPEPPPTTTPQVTRIVERDAELGWQIWAIAAFLVLLLISVLAVQLRPEWFKRKMDDEDEEFLTPPPEGKKT